MNASNGRASRRPAASVSQRRGAAARWGKEHVADLDSTQDHAAGGREQVCKLRNARCGEPFVVGDQHVLHSHPARRSKTHANARFATVRKLRRRQKNTSTPPPPPPPEQLSKRSKPAPFELRIRSTTHSFVPPSLGSRFVRLRHNHTHQNQVQGVVPSTIIFLYVSACARQTSLLLKFQWHARGWHIDSKTGRHR